MPSKLPEKSAGEDDSARNIIRKGSTPKDYMLIGDVKQVRALTIFFCFRY